MEIKNGWLDGYEPGSYAAGGVEEINGDLYPSAETAHRLCRSHLERTGDADMPSLSELECLIEAGEYVVYQPR